MTNSRKECKYSYNGVEERKHLNQARKQESNGKCEAKDDAARVITILEHHVKP